MTVSTYDYATPRRRSSAGSAAIQFVNTVGVSICATVGGLVFALATHLMM